MTNEKVINTILNIYSDAEIQLLGLVSKYLDLGVDNNIIDNNTWAGLKLSNIRKLLLETKEVIDTLEGKDDIAKQAIIDAYLNGAGTTSGTFIQTNELAIKRLVTDYLGELKNVRIQILRQINDKYKEIIGKAIQTSVIGTQTRLTTAKKALVAFANEGITAFYDKNGKQYDLRGYVMMATRTGTNNAFRDGRVAKIVNDGNDLIIVRTSPRYCELCNPYKNKVLSISGKDDRYVSLDVAKSKGLFHANCRCSLAEYVPELTKIKDEDKVPNEYEVEQKQRYLERQKRKWSRVLAVDNTNNLAKQRIKDYNNKLNDLVTDSEALTRKPRNESIKAAR